MSNRVSNIYRDVIRKVGDNWPPIYVTVKDDDGTAVNLTDASVKLCTRAFSGGTWTETAGNIEDADTGLVSAVPPTTTSGRYIGYIEVTQTNKVYTIPDDGYLMLEVLEASP